MAKRAALDRFLQRRGDRWQYVRRVPASVAPQDQRSRVIRMSLKTHDLGGSRLNDRGPKRTLTDDRIWALCRRAAPDPISVVDCQSGAA